VIQSLFSIAVFVTDIDRAKQFYSDTLGLQCTREGSFGAEYQQGETRLGVHPAVHPDAQALVGRHTGITFHVSDLLDFCERLHSRGVRFINEPTQQSFGIMAMVTDPDDNIFALWEDKLPEQPA
jgi:predicted enzyme related to lactoylglutathione lyase